jgi:CO/xanthine dehydrogenase FAD-binding subunit
VTFDVPEERFVAGFKKFGTRPALDISVVSVGVAGIKEDGVIRNARVAFGAVAPTPLRGRKTEAAIEGQQMNEAQMAAVGRMAREEISPISDVRGSAWYRKELIGTLTQRLLRDVT